MSQGLSHVKPRSGIKTPRSMRKTITSSKALRLVDLMTTNLVVIGLWLLDGCYNSQGFLTTVHCINLVVGRG
jgi:hypothetical protein